MGVSSADDKGRKGGQGEAGQEAQRVTLPLPVDWLAGLELREVVERAEAAYRAVDAPIASVEGFVRQIIGWRDYVWHLYWYEGHAYRRANELGATERLPTWFAELDADPGERIHNCEVLHYTRLDPVEGVQASRLSWVRRARPVDIGGTWTMRVTPWRKLEFHTYSNADLLKQIVDVPSLRPDLHQR